mmetsp:Transcript_25441/g.71138  ORF Transcript_25441/g.71138 Transcript_25441/m.71138 type:complete len:234 (+) Transcript_25441:1178-1879(+)
MGAPEGRPCPASAQRRLPCGRPPAASRPHHPASRARRACPQAAPSKSAGGTHGHLHSLQAQRCIEHSVGATLQSRLSWQEPCSRAVAGHRRELASGLLGAGPSAAAGGSATALLPTRAPHLPAALRREVRTTASALHGPAVYHRWGLRSVASAHDDGPAGHAEAPRDGQQLRAWQPRRGGLPPSTPWHARLPPPRHAHLSDPVNGMARGTLGCSVLRCAHLRLYSYVYVDISV